MKGGGTMKIVWYTSDFGRVYYDNKLVAYATKDEKGNIIYK